MKFLAQRLPTLALALACASTSAADAQLVGIEHMFPVHELLHPLEGRCDAELSQYFQPGERAAVVITTHRTDSRWVAYAEGQLSFDGTYLVGQTSARFSDRMANDGCPPAGEEGFCWANQPFADADQDEWRVWISREGAVTVENLTWGGSVVVETRCTTNGMIYGRMPGAFVTISLKLLAPPPR